MSELTQEIRGMRADFREALTKLFGDAEGENVHGRIPRLESLVDDHERRVVTLEEMHARGRGAWQFAGWVIAALLGAGQLLYYAAVVFGVVKGR